MAQGRQTYLVIEKMHVSGRPGDPRGRVAEDEGEVLLERAGELRDPGKSLLGPKEEPSVQPPVRAVDSYWHKASVTDTEVQGSRAISLRTLIHT